MVTSNCSGRVRRRQLVDQQQRRLPFDLDAGTEQEWQRARRRRRHQPGRELGQVVRLHQHGVAELLADFLRVLGPNHPDTLIARNNLAYLRAVAGDAAGAVAALEGLLTDLLRVLGPDHPSTLTARVNLARWQLGTGDAAATALEELLTDLLRVLGLDHPHTLTARRLLAGVPAAKAR